MAKDTSTSSPLGDFLAFRTMITPVIIQILCWLGGIACITVGIIMIAQDSFQREEQIIQGVLLILFGPLAVRIYCETLILFFRMNQTLTEIKNKR